MAKTNSLEGLGEAEDGSNVGLYLCRGRAGIETDVGALEVEVQRQWTAEKTQVGQFNTASISFGDESAPPSGACRLWAPRLEGLTQEARHPTINITNTSLGGAARELGLDS